MQGPGIAPRRTGYEPVGRLDTPLWARLQVSYDFGTKADYGEAGGEAKAGPSS
jgi:hypothetical protein